MLESFGRAEKKLKPNPELLFDDVYDELLPHLEKQKREMKNHVAKYADHYPLNNFKQMS